MNRECIHKVEQHRSALRGVEAMSLLTDRGFPRHAHDQFGIGVLIAGAQRSWSGIGIVEAQAGDVITVNPGEVHDGHAVGGRARGWQMLYVESALVAHIVEDAGWQGAEFARPAMRDPTVASLFAGAFSALTSTRTDDLRVDEALSCTILLVLHRHGRQPCLDLGTVPSVLRAKRAIDEAPHRNVNLDDLAVISGVSRFQLLRGFARQFGITPHAYLVQQRVRLARRHLAAGSAPAEAAAAAGFADQSHLTRAFTRQYGVTPARYRAMVV